MKGRNSADDMKLPQKETMLITYNLRSMQRVSLVQEEQAVKVNTRFRYSPRSLFVVPVPTTQQGHSTILRRVNTTAGTPSTMICRTDSSLAPHNVQRKGLSFSSSCMFAHPFRFLYQYKSMQ